MKCILALTCIAALLSCTKHDLPKAAPKPTATLELTRTTIYYDGITTDSTVGGTWVAAHGVSIWLNGVSVGNTGTFKSKGIFKDTSFTLVVANGNDTARATKSVQVMINPILALLGHGWFLRTKLEGQFPSGWIEFQLSPTQTDDKILFMPNRKIQYDMGSIRNPNEPQYGYAESAFILRSPTTLYHEGVEWTIIELTQSRMVLEGYIPGIFGSPDRYSRETYVRVP